MVILTRSGNEAKYQRIGKEIRQTIMTGKLAYGTRLPSMKKMAAEYETSIFTIQNALRPLIREGLLDSTPRRGTFVRSLPNKLRSIGVYFGRDFMAGTEMAFYRELDRQLSRELSIDGVSKSLWTDSREEKSQDQPLPDLLAAVRNREIQGLIVACANRVDMEWIQTLGIPISATTTFPVPSRVLYDSRQMASVAIGEIKRLGCRSVGLIVPRPVWGPEASDHGKDIVEMFAEFLDLARDVGLNIKNEWIRTPPHRVFDDQYEEFGYQQFNDLWMMKERPDGVLVYPDMVGRGVATAILQAGASVPKDVKLVFHRSEGVAFFCPLRVSWIVASVRQMALALIEQVQRQLDGKNVAPVYLPFALEPLDLGNPRQL